MFAEPRDHLLKTARGDIKKFTAKGLREIVLNIFFFFFFPRLFVCKEGHYPFSIALSGVLSLAVMRAGSDPLGYR